MEPRIHLNSYTSLSALAEDYFRGLIMEEFQIDLLWILTCCPLAAFHNCCSVNQSPHNAARPLTGLDDSAYVGCLLLGQSSASTAKRPEEARNLFRKVWACLHCLEIVNWHFCCFMSVTGITGRREQDKRNTRACEFRLWSWGHQVHDSVCVLYASKIPMQRQYLIKTSSSAANS